MREISRSEMEAVGGGEVKTPGGTAGDVILTASGALLGFLLTGGNPAGAWLGATAGHAYAMVIID